MKKLIIFLSFILVSCSKPEPIDIDKLNYRNEIYYKVNSSEPYSGDVFSVYPNGQYQRYGNLKNGKFIGSVKYFHTNGQLFIEEPYQNGKVNGTSTEYLEDGEISKILNFKDGILNGPFTYYYDKVYKRNKEVGFYLEGEVHGAVETFRKDGSLWYTKNYIMGKQDGPTLMYDENGELVSYYNYKDDKMDGPFEKFSSDGSRVKGNYKDDKMDGPYEEFFPNGSLREKGQYKNGKKDRRWVLYDFGGEEYYEFIYILGELIVSGIIEKDRDPLKEKTEEIKKNLEKNQSEVNN